MTCNVKHNGFTGSKPKDWVHWVIQVMGVAEGDTVDDLFHGSGAVAQALAERTLF